MNLIDYLMDMLFGSPNPQAAQNFVNNPLQAASSATGQAVTATQLQTAYTAVAPASAALGGGDPIVGMQRAVANHNNLEFEPQRVFSPDTEVASRNNTNAEFLSNNDPQVLSPHAGENVQQGGVNLDFSDMTFGDRNEASEGSVINTGTAGDIDATNVKGDGNVVGDDNENVNTGDIEDSNVNIGEGNEIDDRGDQTAGGDIISGNEGPVVKTGDIDASGGNGGNASGGDGAGGIFGGGDGGAGGNAAGGAGGGVVIAPTQTTTTNTGGGDITNVDTGGGDINGSVDASHDDNSVDNSDHSTHDSHDDNSTHDSHDATVETNVDVTNDVGIF